MRDYQRSKVYDWESDFQDGQWVPFEQAQLIIDYIWSDMGLQNPPKLKIMRSVKWAGKANRVSLWLNKEGASTRTIIHELAHSMTSIADSGSHMHGPKFVGVYMVMLEKYIKIPMALMMYTAKKDKVDFEPYAKPIITDN